MWCDPRLGTHERGRLGAADDARLVGLRDACTLRAGGRLGTSRALRSVGARGRLHDGLHAGEAGRADAGTAALAAGQFEQLVFVHVHPCATTSAFTLCLSVRCECDPAAQHRPANLSKSNSIDFSHPHATTRSTHVSQRAREIAARIDVFGRQSPPLPTPSILPLARRPRDVCRPQLSSSQFSCAWEKKERLEQLFTACSYCSGKDDTDSQRVFICSVLGFV